MCPSTSAYGVRDEVVHVIALDQRSDGGDTPRPTPGPAARAAAASVNTEGVQRGSQEALRRRVNLTLGHRQARRLSTISTAFAPLSRKYSATLSAA